VRRAFRNQRFANLIPLTSKIKKPQTLFKREGFCIANLKGLHLGFSPLGRLGGAKNIAIKEALRQLLKS